LVLDAAAIAQRSRRLAARDALNLAGAYKAVTEESGNTVDAALSDGLSRLAADREADAGPRQLRQLATNRTQKALYAQHRLCSAVVHPGELVDDRKARRLVSRLIDEVAVLAAAFGRSISKTIIQAAG
jgi:hypothetical protein